jgi:uncharacterized protein involved in exopolysaccharide biosynthesis
MKEISDAGDLSLRDFLLPLFRRKRVLIYSFISVLAVFIVLSLLRGPVYSSHMEVLVNRERVDPLVSTQSTTQMISTDSAVTPEEVNSEVELLSSRDVLEQVVLQNGLENSHGFSPVDLLFHKNTKEDRVARAVKRLAKHLNIDNVKNSNLIEIAYQSPHPEVAYGVLKSLGDLYVAKHVAVHRPAGSYQFFAEETEKYRQEMEDAEGKLRDFGVKTGVSDPDEERTDLAGQVANSVGLLHLTEQTIAGDDGRIKKDRQQLKAMQVRVVTLQSSATNDKLIGDLNTALLAAQTKRTQLVAKYDPNYPLVKEADQEIAQDKASLSDAVNMKYVTETTDRDPTYELLREDIAKTEGDLSAQTSTLIATKASIQNIQAEMVNLDQMSLAQQDLQREAKAAEGNYLLYLAKREQERTSDALDVTRIANVAIAVPPAIPVLPVSSWPFILLEGFGLALVLAVGAAYAADFLDPSFHTPSQIIDVLGIPVIVSIPMRST